MDTTFLITNPRWKVTPKNQPNSPSGWEVSVDLDEFQGTTMTEKKVISDELEMISGGNIASFKYSRVPEVYLVFRPNLGDESTLSSLIGTYSISTNGIKALVCQGRGGLDETSIALVTTDKEAALKLANEFLFVANPETAKNSPEKPAISMMTFFALPEVKKFQVLQKLNAWGSARHRYAYDQIKHLASLFGAEHYLGEY